MQQQQLAAQLANHGGGRRPEPPPSPSPSNTSDSDISLGAHSPPPSRSNSLSLGSQSPPRRGLLGLNHSPPRSMGLSPSPIHRSHSPPRHFMGHLGLLNSHSPPIGLTIGHGLPRPHPLSLGPHSPPRPLTMGPHSPAHTVTQPLPLTLHRPFSPPRLSWYPAMLPLQEDW